MTFLKWFPVTLDANNNHVAVLQYNIYRSSSANLEAFQQIAQITAPDDSGQIDTAFNEFIDGFYAYGITAVSSVGEGPMATRPVVPGPQPERIGNGSFSSRIALGTGSAPATAYPPLVGVPRAPVIDFLIRDLG